MPKIIIEVEEDLKWQFKDACNKKRESQKDILISLIKQWLKRR